ncbi:MAG: tetratricopeptide repeat protein [Bacteroidetes bacterium]|nr:tetratricopeptide repeat protein [Bacteroidota bacterium]
MSFFLFCSWCFAGHSKIDSLQTILKTAKEDTNKVTILNELCRQLWQKGQYDTAYIHAENAKRLSEKINFKTGLADAYNNMGTICKSKGDYKEAIKYHLLALQIRKEIGNKKGIAASYNSIGLVYSHEGNYPDALKNYFLSLKIKEEILQNAEHIKNAGDIYAGKRGIGTTYNNIGGIYAREGEYSQALNYFSQSLQVRQEIADKQGIADCYHNLGSVYQNLKNDSEALENYSRALKMFMEIEDKDGIAMCYDNMGIIYKNQGKTADALTNYLHSLNINQDIGSKQGMAAASINIGVVLTIEKKYIESQNYLDKGLKLANEIGEKEFIKEAYSGLSDLSAAKGDFKSAYDYHQKYSQIKDSILNEESSKQIAEMQTKYETEKKEQQITLLNKDKELQDAQLNRQKIVIWSVAGGFLIVLVLSLFIYKERRKSEKLLLNILPAETAKELKAKGKASPKYYESVTVMFTDFKGFTTIAEKLSAEELVSELDFLFKKFDEIISRYNIEKIKTIGDAYMCASGLPLPNENHAEEIVKAALEIQNFMKSLELGVRSSETNTNHPTPNSSLHSLRIGIHSGPVTAGVVGDKKFAYDIWGDTVNTASRMESSGEPGKINISGATYQILQGFENLEGLEFKFRGKIPAKNKGEIEMYFVENKV